MIELEGIIKKPSPLTYDYATIKITQSRINKGLIAIPASLAKWFPQKNGEVQIYFDESSTPQTKHYTAYSSTQREYRIEGLTKWLRDNKIKTGDEIVIQLLDQEKFIYRITPEKRFINTTQKLEKHFDSSKSEIDASENIAVLTKWINQNKEKVSFNEYFRLSQTPFSGERVYIKRNEERIREQTPANIKILLGNIYHGQFLNL